ncbi:MAG: hypothetical protein ACRDA9_01210, partial [Plesiomonas shigelloides]
VDVGSRLYPSYLKLQRCWLGSFTPSTSFAYTHEDSLTGRLPATSRCLGMLCFLGTLFGVMMNGAMMNRLSYGK